MTSSRLATAAFVAVIFAAGAVTGLSADRWWLARSNAQDRDEIAQLPEPGYLIDEAIARLRADLDLDPEQEAEVRALLIESRREVFRVRARMQPEMRAVLGRYRAEIRERLDPDAQRRYDELIERFDREQARRLRQRLRTLRTLGEANRDLAGQSPANGSADESPRPAESR